MLAPSERCLAIQVQLLRLDHGCLVDALAMQGLGQRRLELQDQLVHSHFGALRMLAPLKY